MGFSVLVRRLHCAFAQMLGAGSFWSVETCFAACWSRNPLLPLTS
jgi:hypothetical protein